MLANKAFFGFYLHWPIVKIVMVQRLRWLGTSNVWTIFWVGEILVCLAHQIDSWRSMLPYQRDVIRKHEHFYKFLLPYRFPCFWFLSPETYILLTLISRIRFVMNFSRNSRRMNCYDYVYSSYCDSTFVLCFLVWNVSMLNQVTLWECGGSFRLCYGPVHTSYFSL